MRHARELDAARLASLTALEPGARWTTTLAELGLPARAEGPPGSAPALAAALYVRAAELAELEALIARGRARVRLTFVAPPWTWGLPVAVWALAFLAAMAQGEEDERLLMFSRVWAGGAALAGALLLWMAWQNLAVNRERQALARDAAARREATVSALLADRDALLAQGFIARTPTRTLAHVPALHALRAALRAADPADRAALQARLQALTEVVDGLGRELPLGWHPPPDAG